MQTVRTTLTLECARTIRMFGVSITLIALCSPWAAWPIVRKPDYRNLGPIATTVSERLLVSWKSEQPSVSHERRESKKHAFMYRFVRSFPWYRSQFSYVQFKPVER